MPRPRPPAPPRETASWRRLGLQPNAPACVIKAAHRYHIELHHPDRGGDVATAQQINIAYDILKERGAPANEHVATFYNGEPWHVLGVSATADQALAERAGRALTSELATFKRLRDRVEWAVQHFGEAPKRTAPPVAQPAQPRARKAQAAPQRHVPERELRQSRPDGLPERIDLGSVRWQADVTADMRLTWRAGAPYAINIDADGPVIAQVTASKAVPGRFAVTVSIDWDAPELAGGTRARRHDIDATLRLRWAASEAEVRVIARIEPPAIVTASPQELDLGTHRLGSSVRATLLLISTAPVEVTVACPPWLRRTDAAGRAQDAPLRLPGNAPVRVALTVDWAPIAQRAAAVTAGKPVRPTGTVRIRWPDGSIDVPAQVVAKR